MSIPRPANKLLQGLAVQRRIWMEWEMHPLHFNAIIFFQFFNTHGAEVTPRSNVVRENFQCNRFGHKALLSS